MTATPQPFDFSIPPVEYRRAHRLEPIVFTIGYGGLGRDNLPGGKGYAKEEDVIEDLKRIVAERRAVLVDIRSRPYGLVNMPMLKKALGEWYVWVGELGHPQYQQNAPKMNLEKYGPRIILMCAEKNVNECHRLDTARWIAKNRGDEIEHLNTPPVKESKKTIGLDFFA